MNFCPNCQSGLYPTEIEQELLLVCRICDYKEANKSLVIRRKVYHGSNAQHYQGDNKYLIYDPTYPRTKQMPCPNPDCPSVADKTLQEAIYYNDPNNLKVIYICCSCRTQWRVA